MRTYAGISGAACVMSLAAFAGAAEAQTAATAPAVPAARPASDIYGSSSCRSCHEPFYQKWATSFHGLAMQPFRDELARTKLTPQKEALPIGKVRYRADIEDGRREVIESGPDGEKRYPIEHVMGGKNVYYFLTPLDRGRLQVLPVAYDVRRKAWFDTTASAVRHFGDRRDEPLDWRDRQLTFNTSCYGCHVSQLSTNYDLASDTYRRPGPNRGSTARPATAPGASTSACSVRPRPGSPRRTCGSSARSPSPTSRTTPFAPPAMRRWS